MYTVMQFGFFAQYSIGEARTGATSWWCSYGMKKLCGSGSGSDLEPYPLAYMHSIIMKKMAYFGFFTIYA
jgi:hypothetical protein